MRFIDWSDPETMLGLLVEYVADEAMATQDDRGRADFLDQLSKDLLDVADQELDSSVEIAKALREILDSQLRDFVNDPVMIHIAHCIEELARISRNGSTQSPLLRRVD